MQGLLRAQVCLEMQMEEELLVSHRGASTLENTGAQYEGHHLLTTCGMTHTLNVSALFLTAPFEVSEG